MKSIKKVLLKKHCNKNRNVVGWGISIGIDNIEKLF